jgi:hypothetical protein
VVSGRRFQGLGALPKVRFHNREEEVHAKARAMMRAGASDADVSDYLGMIEEQVAEVRRNMHETRQGRPPSVPAGGPGESGDAQLRARELDGELGSAALAAKIEKLHAKQRQAA